MPTVPEYRVRLFLSVDLTGSTAFKHKNENPLEWIKAFQKFYRDFPQKIGNNYASICKEMHYLLQTEVESGLPRLWKTIGDEIIFTCKITSLCHLSAAFKAFIKTLNEFGGDIKSKYPDLNTKGNAWVASFPTPNVSLKPLRASEQQQENIQDALTGGNESTSEEMEQEVDTNPHLFDFLGKGIDAGFRISKNSEIERLTISPGLGILLLEASESKKITAWDYPIRLDELQSFKGVANGSPYPVLTIDTFRDDSQKELIEIQRKVTGSSKQEPKELMDYLTKYIKYNKIEIPSVRIQMGIGEFNVPKFYHEYKVLWEAEQQREIDNYRDLKNDSLDKTAVDQRIPIPNIFD